MGFGEAIKTCFSKYATFSGRARRSEFWWFYLFAQLVQLPFAILFGILYVAAFVPAFEYEAAYGEDADAAFEQVDWGLLVLGVALLVIVGLFLLLPMLAVWARRLHDMGQTGHWLWLSLIGLGIVPLIMAIFESENRPNRWGPDPRVPAPAA